MSPLSIIIQIANLYILVILVDVILGWLINFQVINGSNSVVRTVHTFTYKLTDPAYRRIRQVIPPIGGLDLSPLVLFFGVQLAVWVIVRSFGGILS